METSLRSWSGRPRPTGFLGGVLFLVGAAAVLLFLAVAAVVSLLVLALVGVVVGAERLLGTVVPAYRRQRHERYLTVPRGLTRMVRFGTRPDEVIEARSYERH